MRIVLAQINPIVGGLEENTKKIIAAISSAKKQSADLVVFPELSLCGYPPDDLLLLPHFMDSVEQCLQTIKAATQGIFAVVGIPRRQKEQNGKSLLNSAVLIGEGALLGFHDKILLPTYDVFDERRYFEPGSKATVWEIKGKKVAVTICEDLWQHSALLRESNYPRDPVLDLVVQKPDLLINLSASPFTQEKPANRLEVCLKTARTLQCPVLLCNQVGGNDSLIFDGYSLYVGKDGALIDRALGFKEDLLCIDTALSIPATKYSVDPSADLFSALVLGVRDYFHKLGFKKACLGVSGGVDSALVAAIAAEALGKENVLGLLMPSRFSSSDGQEDAQQLVKNLGIASKTLPIEPPFQCFLDILNPHFEGHPFDTTEENLQARIRGMLLMAFSNKFGYVVLSTGNKSELAMGYATLYGDMCGGLAVISDLLKREVYQLAHWLNREKELIPNRILERAPSAELREGQRDSDTLPDYEIVDHVLQDYVEGHFSPKQIAKKHGYPLVLVEDLIKRVHFNEYKRRQSAPGLKVSNRAFSVGRRFPIVQNWVGSSCI